jgi:membrane protease YdiL (CAAX protease family)
MPDSAPEALVKPDPPVAVDARDRIGAVIEIVLCSSIPTQLAINAMLRGIGLPTTQPSGEAVAMAVFAQLVLDTVVVIGLMVVILRAHGEHPSAVWKGPRRIGREVTIGFATAPLLFFGSAIFLNALRLFFPSLHNVQNNPLERLAGNAQQSAIFAVVAVLAGGIREELQRGFMLYRFEKYLGGGTVGLVVTSVLFGVLHGIQGWDAMIVTGCLGAFWAAMYLARRSAIGPMSSHALFDTLQILRLAVGGGR